MDVDVEVWCWGCADAEFDDDTGEGTSSVDFECVLPVRELGAWERRGLAFQVEVDVGSGRVIEGGTRERTATTHFQ